MRNAGVIVAIFGWATFVGAGHAQAPALGTVNGVVLNAQREPSIPCANSEVQLDVLTGDGGALFLSGHPNYLATDSEGRWSATVPPGQYAATVGNLQPNTRWMSTVFPDGRPTKRIVIEVSAATCAHAQLTLRPLNEGEPIAFQEDANRVRAALESALKDVGLTEQLPPYHAVGDTRNYRVLFAVERKDINSTSYIEGGAVFRFVLEEENNRTTLRVLRSVLELGSPVSAPEFQTRLQESVTRRLGRGR